MTREDDATRPPRSYGSDSIPAVRGRSKNAGPQTEKRQRSNSDSDIHIDQERLSGSKHTKRV